MKKRKVSVEKGSRYRESSARPSLVSSRATDTSHQRRSRFAKSPSVQNLKNLDSSDRLTKSEDGRTMLPDEMQPPKTGFNSRGRSKEKARSIFSPRLKSFPAEKMKKLDDPQAFSSEPIGALIVQQNPRETGIFFVGPSAESNNNGHGDATSVQSPPPMHQQLKPPNATSTSEQQVVANHQQMGQAIPQPDNLLTRQVASPGRQARRPFVPNTFQGAAVRDRSPRNPPTTFSHSVIIQGPSTQTTATVPQTRQSLYDSRALVDRDRNEAIGFDDGRNVADRRQTQQQTQAAIAWDTNAPPNDRNTNNCQGVRLQDVRHAQSHGPFYPEIPRQIYQQSRHNAYHGQTQQQALGHARSMYNQQQQMHNNSAICCNCSNQQLSAALLPGQGMTSPQDMTMSQMKLMQHSALAHEQNLGYSVQLQPAWPQNNRWMHTASNNQRHLHQQSSPQQQRYYQTRDAQNPDSHQQSFESHVHQSIPPENQTSRKSTNEQSIMKDRSRQGGGKKVLQFTPDMIHDQELLVSTMRQQGVPDDVMRRQFDALLSEQRRHLAYVAQFQEREDAPEAKRTYRYARRLTDRDEKPEWMVHITPPRISYSEVETMKTQRRVPKEQYPTDQSSEEVSRTMPAQQRQLLLNKNYYQQKEKETTDQATPSQQMYFQVNPHQSWQQQTANWPCKSDRQTPCGYAVCYPYNHQQSQSSNVHHQSSTAFNGSSNQQQSFCQYLHDLPYNPYNAYSEHQKVWSKECNAISPEPMDNQRVSVDSAHFYEQSKRPAESSSLLKMRVYKEVIRPQKRNNGLQDPDTIQKAFEALKDPTSRRGLEYLASLAKRKPAVRLNGTQDPDEVPENLQPRPPLETISRNQKRLSANGLENGRNRDNHQPCVLRPKRADEPMMTEYPRQRQQAETRDSVQTGRENGAMMISQQRESAAAISHTLNAESVPYDHQNAFMSHERHSSNDPTIDPSMMHQFGGAPHCHRMQQYYLNRRNVAGHNGGQGDVAGIPRQAASGAMRIDRAGGDTGENSSAEDTTKRVGGARSTRGTNVYGQPEISEAGTMDCVACPAGKPDYAANNLIVSPDKLIASRHLQPPMILS